MQPLNSSHSYRDWPFAYALAQTIMIKRPEVAVNAVYVCVCLVEANTPSFREKEKERERGVKSITVLCVTKAEDCISQK